jgi:DNA invertase Pin-like site-specific DNA recombinase
MIEVEISSMKTIENRKINEAVSSLGKKGILITTEISRLGRKVSEVMALVESLLQKGHRIFFLNYGIDLNPDSSINYVNNLIINIFAMVAQFEREQISMRTQQALALRISKGIKLGKPKGVAQKSIYDEHAEKIKEYMIRGANFQSISNLIGVGKSRSLVKFIKRKGLKKEIKKESNREI